MIEKNRKCFINFKCFKNDFNFRIIKNNLFESHSRVICFNFDFNYCMTHYKKIVAVIEMYKHDFDIINNCYEIN